MSLPIVSIVGRPNVGKSHLFNRLAGKRLSIVEDTPGVTRDRLYAPINWRGRDFMIADTGGIEPHTDDEMLRFMRTQAKIAIAEADVVILVTDLRVGVTAADEDVATMLQRAGKPIVLAVNKCDTIGEPPAEFYEFYSLGTGDPVAVSALHGYGTGDLLDRCFEHFPPEEEELVIPDSINVAVIGKPNAGKSSLINRILGENRVIVSDIAGTTRDAVDVAVENEHGKYVFIDTAGMRRKGRVDDEIEKYSVMRSLMAVDRADVCPIMIDAKDGITEQDTKVAGYAHEKGKASIFVINKWDLIEKNTNTMKEFEEKVRQEFGYMRYAPVAFISALTGQRVDGLFPMINMCNEQSAMRISTGQLNDVLRDAITRVQPPTDRGRRLKIYYMTQTSIKPPHFVLFCNDAELFHYSYQRYIENRIREVFGLTGTPVRMTIRQKGDET